VVALAAIVAADLVLGGGAHLSRSVLEAGGLDELADVVERRVTLSERSFTNEGIGSPYLFACLVLIVLAVIRRRDVAGWFAGRRAAWAGFLGAGAAIGVATLANDSGSLLLMIGTGYLTIFAGLAWSSAPDAPAEGVGPAPAEADSVAG
jgi:hypothetical protein